MNADVEALNLFRDKDELNLPRPADTKSMKIRCCLSLPTRNYSKHNHVVVCFKKQR